MNIVSIEKAPRSRERVIVRLDDGTVTELARELVLRAGFRTGEAIDPDRLRRLTREDGKWRARDAALRLLAHRPRTASELRQRLLRKELPVDLVEECLSELEAQRLLDDANFAEMFARDRIRLRPQGRRRMLQELRVRGVQEETASAAVDSAMEEEETDELALARQSVRRWRARPGEEPQRARRRLAAYLARRGFGADTAAVVLDEVLGEA